jgi:putative tryptophan/tyrosine transport system substrate-binding protein
MRRRDFITLLGGAAAAWPLAARAQQPSVPVIGFMSSRAAADSAPLVAAFRQGLSEAGYVEGQNVAIEFRWADGRYDRLPALAADLIMQKVAVLAAVGGEPSALAAKTATSTIPIVFTVGGDPIKIGLVASMNRPGGNATGVSLLAIEPEAKRLSMLHELVPRGGLIAVVINPNFADFESRKRELSEAARVLDRRIEYYEARNDAELELAFSRLVQAQAAALLPTGDPFFDTRRDRIIAFAAQSRLPSIHPFREYAIAGGLMTYGISLTEGYRQTGNYAGLVLKGAKPAELPVYQSIKFELIINLKTAKALGIELPANLLALADEVIE